MNDEQNDQLRAPALYDPDWVSLLDSRERLKAKGAGASEAETAIRLALRDRKLKARFVIEKVTYAPTGAKLTRDYVRELEFKEGVKLQLAVPADLKPADIDWDNSRPLRPWPYGPWQHQLLAHVARIEVWRAGLERVFPMLKASSGADRPPAEAESEEREEASPTSAKATETTEPSSGASEMSGEPLPPGAGRDSRKRACLLVKELWPKGVPSKDELSNTNLVADVMARAKSKGWSVGSRETILRAAGRRK